eukprot:COSAG06_NODE_4122_length_4548_cov_102.653405_3_plen_276_part_00
MVWNARRAARGGDNAASAAAIPAGCGRYDNSGWGRQAAEGRLFQDVRRRPSSTRTYRRSINTPDFECSRIYSIEFLQPPAIEAAIDAVAEERRNGGYSHNSWPSMVGEVKRLKVTCVARNAAKANFLTTVSGNLTVRAKAAHTLARLDRTSFGERLSVIPPRVTRTRRRTRAGEAGPRGDPEDLREDGEQPDHADLVRSPLTPRLACLSLRPTRGRDSFSHALVRATADCGATTATGCTTRRTSCHSLTRTVTSLPATRPRSRPMQYPASAPRQS